MADPIDMILPLLREMRTENATLHEQTHAILKELDRRLGTVEAAQVSYRQALTADTMMSKLVTGEFEERIQVLERKVRELESQR
jgi:hypothetical protein